MCSTLWATRKLRHYMLTYKVLLIARMDPLKYLMEKPVQDGKTAKLVLLLSKFDIKYVTQKSVKGMAIVDHLAYCSPKEAEEIQGDFPDEDISNKSKQKWNWSSLNFSKRGTHPIFWQTQLPCHQQCHRI